MRYSVIIVFTLFCFNTFSQTNSIKRDTLTYKENLDVFHNYLNGVCKNLDTVKYGTYSLFLDLEQKCSDILWFVHSKTNYNSDEMYVYNPVIYSYTIYEIGGRNYPEVYYDIYKLYNIAKKIQQTKNEKQFTRFKTKLISKINKYLKEY